MVPPVEGEPETKAFKPTEDGSKREEKTLLISSFLSAS